MDKKYFSYPRMIFFLQNIYFLCRNIFIFNRDIFSSGTNIVGEKIGKKKILFFKYLSLHSSCGIEKYIFSFDSTIVHLMKFLGHVTNTTELNKADGKQRFQIIESSNIK